MRPGSRTGRLCLTFALVQGQRKKAQLFGQSRAPKATRQEIGAEAQVGGLAQEHLPRPAREGFSVSGWAPNSMRRHNAGL